MAIVVSMTLEWCGEMSEKIHLDQIGSNHMSKEKRKRRFGTIAISKGIISLEQFTEAIEIQAKEELTETKHRLIGEILVDLGFMDPAQVNAIMNELVAVAFRFECPHCGIMIFKCPNCGEELR
jgi:hypothetical protein